MESWVSNHVQRMPSAHPHPSRPVPCWSMPGAAAASTSSAQWTSEAVGHRLRLLPSSCCCQLRRPDFQSFSGFTCLVSFSFGRSSLEPRGSSECWAATSTANCSSSSFGWVIDWEPNFFGRCDAAGLRFNSEALAVAQLACYCHNCSPH